MTLDRDHSDQASVLGSQTLIQDTWYYIVFSFEMKTFKETSQHTQKVRLVRVRSCSQNQTEDRRPSSAESSFDKSSLAILAIES